MNEKILIGPRDQVVLVEPTDRFGAPLGRAIAVRPARRVVYEGDELYELKMHVLETLLALPGAIRAFSRRARRRALEIAALRKARHVARRAWASTRDAIAEDRPIAQFVVLALLSAAVYLILAW